MEDDYVSAWLDCHYNCRCRVTREAFEPRTIRITCTVHWDGAGNAGHSGDAIIVRDYDVTL